MDIKANNADDEQRVDVLSQNAAIVEMIYSKDSMPYEDKLIFC